MTTKNRADSEEADGVLVLALASGCTYQQAADRVGVGVSTVSRRMRTHAFRRRVSEQRAELIERGGGRIADELAASVTFLAQLRDDQGETTSVRLKAAMVLIGSAMKYRRLDPSPSYRPSILELDRDLLVLGDSDLA
jgi:transcriptional regulator with XRE-family HTH domain